MTPPHPTPHDRSPTPPHVRLLVNADDLGQTPGINRAVAELHAAGALCSATLMATGPAFQHAVDLARAHPGLALGCHIVLTDGLPILPSTFIPSLLDPSARDTARFRPSLARFVAAVLLGGVRESEVAAEATAQIHRLQAAGVHVTHMDTHKHTHALPLVARALLTAAETTGVRALRNPFEPAWSLRIGRATPLRRLQLALARRLRPRFLALPALRSGRVLTTDGTIGISATGHLRLSTLAELLRALPPHGTWELVCHPGYNDSDLGRVTTRLRASREVELHALLRTFGGPPRRPLPGTPTPPAIIHYGDLIADAPPSPPRSTSTP